jgi:hypothetical protein
MKTQTTQMKRIMGMTWFPNMRAAVKGMDALEDAGYEFRIRHDAIDDLASTVFVEAWRYIANDADERAATSAIFDELLEITDRFDGDADEVGVFAEGEHHNLTSTCRRIMH